MYKDKLNYKLLNILILAAIIFLVLITNGYWLGLLGKIVSIVSPFVIAFAIAYALNPAVRKLEAKGVRRNLAVTLIVVLIGIIIIGIGWMTIHLLYDQLIDLYRGIGDIITDVSNKFSVNLGDFRNTINSVMNQAISSVGKYVSNGTINFMSKSVSIASTAIIVAIVSIYFLADMNNIRARVKRLLKRSKNKEHYMAVKAMDHELGQYLSGLSIFMIIQFFEYSILFKLVGHPNWLLLGLLACITTVIPYFGGLITNIIAVILATVVSTPVFIGTLIICLVFPNLDGYVISPKVYGKTNNISPLWTIFAVFAGGALYGITGIIIALPLYIIINCALRFYKDDIQEKISDGNKKRSK